MCFPISQYSPIDRTMIPPKSRETPRQVEAAYFRVASRIRYRLQLFDNLSFDQLDRLRIETKMKKLAEPDKLIGSASLITLVTKNMVLVN